MLANTSKYMTLSHIRQYIEIEFVETAYLTGGDGTRISWNSSCGLEMDFQSIVLILLAVLIAYLFRNETK